MYLIAHQNDCQMVVGSIMKIRTPESLRETWEGDAALGFRNSDTALPRQCTCEPNLIELIRSDGSHAGNWVMPTVIQ